MVSIDEYIATTVAQKLGKSPAAYKAGVSAATRREGAIMSRLSGAEHSLNPLHYGMDICSRSFSDTNACYR